MADYRHVVVIGPDLVSGAGPDGDLPAPGPDKSNFIPEESAPGTLLGTIANVYYFDDAISKVLGGTGEDWKYLTIDITQKQFDCELDIEDVVIKDGTHLYIHHPEVNNIPQNVFVVLSDRLNKGSSAPNEPDNITRHHWYYNPDDPDRGEWYISDALKVRLEKLYNWTFFENVDVGADWGSPIIDIESKTFNGGVEVTEADIQYHDLHLALDSTIPLEGEPDSRAKDGRMDFVVLVGYSPETDPSISNITAEITSGDCGDKDFVVTVSWGEVTFDHDLVGVLAYHVYRKSSVDADPELIAATNNETFFFADTSIKEDVAANIIPCGVSGAPTYYVRWISTDGEESALSAANPVGVLASGIPCCDPGNISITGTKVGECWKPEYGTVTLAWNIDVSDGVTSPQTIVINRSVPLIPELNNTITLDKTYQQFDSGYIDSGLNILPACDPELTYEVTYEIILTSVDDVTGEEMMSADYVTVTIECCDCTDLDDNPFADDGEGEGEGTNYCDNCWMDESAELRIWMEGYFEDPLTGVASFDIRYCISNPCILGLMYTDIYLDLPIGTSITSFEANDKAVDASVTKFFDLGVTPGRWRIQIDQTGTGGEVDDTEDTEETFNANVNNLLAPLAGILGTVYIDTPLNLDRVCLDTVGYGDPTLVTVLKDPLGGFDTREYFQYSNVKSESYDEGVDWKWQTGPCLSTCTDEVNMGYGDYYLNVRAVDSDTFDVDYCLAREDFDTFVLVCLMTDFQTMVNAIDDTFGDAVDRGWKIGYRNISPGFAIIYGHGKNPIPSAGLSTLARIHLTNQLIQTSVHEVGDNSLAETCVCVFPLFMQLGDLFDALENYIVGSTSSATGRVMDSERVGGNLGTTYSAPGGYASYSSGIWEDDSFKFASPPPVETFQDGSAFLADMHNIAVQSDPRFAEMISCLADSYDRVISNYTNTQTYSREGGVRESAISTVHYFRIFFMIWVSLVKSIPEMQQKLNNVEERLENLCPNQFEAYAVNTVDDEEIGENKIAVEVAYKFPMCAVSGIEIDFSIFIEKLATLGYTPDWGHSFTGDAYAQNYLQAFSRESNKYLCAYGSNISAQSRGTSKSGYLRTDNLGADGYQILTRFIIDVTPVEDGNDLEATLFNIEAAAEDYTALLAVASNWRATETYEAVMEALESAVVVTNEKLMPPTRKWSGSSYRVGDAAVVDAKDYLTTIMFTLEPENTNLDEEHIEETIILPEDGAGSTAREYYSLDSVDLTGISYEPDGVTPWIDTVGEYVLPGIDADGDGKIGIKDVVSLRNMWVVTNHYPASVTSTIRQNVVPTECCVSFDIDAEIYVPDECSNFCVKAGCFAKLWFSDLIVINDSNDNPEKYLLEVSYAVDCMTRVGNEGQELPVEEFSGVQFKIQGLGGEGVEGTENGYGINDQEDATSVQAAGWDEFILSSGLSTKDTYFTFSTNGQYIPKGKGVLCYLVVSPDSMPSEESYIEQKTNDEFITTNKFRKFDPSPLISEVNLAAGMRVSYPLANLRFRSHHTDELLIYERFGLRISDFKITTNTAYLVEAQVEEGGDIAVGQVSSKEQINITEDPHSNWTGNYEEGEGVSDEALNYVLELAAKKQYDVNFDSDGNEKIDIVDVQTIAHSLYDDGVVFGFEDNAVVPTICCPCDEPEAPNLLVLDHNSDDITVPVVSSFQYGRIREVTLTPKEFGCDPAKKHRGGVLLYWAPVDCDYYIVYRQSPGEAPVAIIGTAPGVRRSSIDFNTRMSGSNKKPIQIIPTMWIDYPPASINKCCDLCDDPDEGEGEGEGEGSEECSHETIEEFEYWVVAINKCNEIESNKELGGIPCCRFKPISEDSTIVVAANETHDGQFKIFHPEAIRPYGLATERQGALPIWTWVDGSSQGSGHYGFSSEGAKVKTESKRPDNRGFNGKNQTGFRYIPKPNFIGKDSFTYSVSVFDEELREKPHQWCKSSATVTVYVVPPSPRVRGRAGVCSDSETRGMALLKWRPVQGVTSYNVYRGEDIVANIENDGSASYRYEEVPPEWIEFNEEIQDCDENLTYSVQYSVSSLYEVEDMESESIPWSVTLDIPCCPPVINPEITVEPVGFCDEAGSELTAGYIEVEWSDLGEIDAYNIYRRGPYQNDAAGLEWAQVGQITTSTEPDVISGKHIFVDEGVVGCDGCGSIHYDYYVTSATVSGEGETQNIATVEIVCCNVAPVAYDQEYTIDYDKTLWQKKLKAIDLDADIVRYEINKFPSEEHGVIYDFNSSTGHFTFDAVPLFQGEVEIPWTVYDSCGEQASAVLTINVQPPVDCSEDDFTICNAVLKWLTEQQDADEIRMKIDELDQVPFMLNTKGVPSLRKRCGAYSVTRGIDPLIFARANDGCKFPEDIIEPQIPFELIVGSITLDICTESFPFGVCKPLTIGSIEPSFECQSEVMFSECKPLTFNSSVTLICDEELAFSSGCRMIPTIGNIYFVCDEELAFSNGCRLLGGADGVFFVCDSSILFGSDCVSQLDINGEIQFNCSEDEIAFGGDCVVQTSAGDAVFGCSDSFSLIVGCGINYENYLIDVIPCFPDGEGEGESHGE